MKLLIAVALAAAVAGSLLYLKLKDNASQLQPVEVDLSRYTGLWYEIARLPFFFERDCYCATANYSLNSDATVKVVNTCNWKSPSGKLNIANGKATPLDPVNGTVTLGDLDVKFGLFGGGSYVVLDLDPNYQYVLVGSNTMKQAWILSRTPTLDQDIYNQLVNEATQDGFDGSKFIQTYQGPDCDRSIDE